MRFTMKRIILKIDKAFEPQTFLRERRLRSLLSKYGIC